MFCFSESTFIDAMLRLMMGYLETHLRTDCSCCHSVLRRKGWLFAICLGLSRKAELCIHPCLESHAVPFWSLKYWWVSGWTKCHSWDLSFTLWKLWTRRQCQPLIQTLEFLTIVLCVFAEAWFPFTAVKLQRTGLRAAAGGLMGPHGGLFCTC